MKTPFVALALLGGLPLCGLACAPGPAPPPAFAVAPVVPIPPEPVAEAPEEPAAEPAEIEPEPEAEPEEEAVGNMWGDSIGDAFGAGGLGLTGSGPGGGGSGQGLGLGRIGGLGHGAGGSAPKVRAGAAVVTGILPAEAIRRVVHRRVGEIRRCYEAALKSSGPDLAGKLAIRFTIGPRGDVISQQMSGGIDPTLDACVGDVFARLQFPAPEGGGVVVVTYPLMFQHADAAPAAGSTPPP